MCLATVGTDKGGGWDAALVWLHNSNTILQCKTLDMGRIGPLGRAGQDRAAHLLITCMWHLWSHSTTTYLLACCCQHAMDPSIDNHVRAVAA